MAATEFQAKITVAKFLQLAYSENEGLTKSIVYSGSSYTVTVDETGEGTLSGARGIVKFSSEAAISGLGLKVKRISVVFSNGDGGTFNYTGTFRFAIGSQISVSGSIDVYKLIMSCSGLLCHAARLLNGRNAQIEQELQQYMH